MCIDLPIGEFSGVLHPAEVIAIFKTPQLASVAHLATSFAIERRLVHHDPAAVARFDLVNQGTVDNQCHNLSFGFLGVIAKEVGRPGEKRAADIMATCEDGTDPIAEEAVEWFVKILGTVAGNLALIQLPFGGIYLIGGVARAVTPYFERYGFSDSFRDKGRFSGFMHNFAVHVIEDDFAALSGLANHLATNR